MVVAGAFEQPHRRITVRIVFVGEDGNPVGEPISQGESSVLANADFSTECNPTTARLSPAHSAPLFIYSLD